MNCLRRAVENYLTMRRSLGFKLRDMGYNLRHFVSFMEQQGTSVITVELALRWAKQPQDVQPAHWAARLGFVRSFPAIGAPLILELKSRRWAFYLTAPSERHPTFTPMRRLNNF